MSDHAFIETVSAICKRDPRYETDAYFFIRDALDYATKSLKKPRQGRGRHITAAELMDSIRTFALREFGPMALTVLRTWGVRKSEDVGDIVFNLVEAGSLGKTDEDRREDFANGFDFETAFHAPFLPDPQGADAGHPPVEPKESL